MAFRPATQHLAKARVTEWAKEVAGSAPITVPVHRIGPEQRSVFNCRDFAQQHGGTSIYGWVVAQHGAVLMAHYYAIVRFHSQIFSVTKTEGGETELLFFEDKIHLPRVISAFGGVDVMNLFYPLAYPETKPARKIVVIDPNEDVAIQMELPPASKRMSSYPAVAPYKPPEPVEEKVDAVVHPALRKVKFFQI